MTATAPRTPSAGEALLAHQLTVVGVPFEREVRFAPPRRWRLDFLVAGTLAVEVEGGAFVHGRHTTGAGFRADCEKYAAVAIRGYRLLRVLPEQVASGEALRWVQRALEADGR